MYDPQGEGAGIDEIFAEALQLVRANMGVFAAIVLIAAIMFSGAEAIGDPSGSSAAVAFLGFVNLYLQLYLLVHIARRRRLLAGREHEDGSPTLGLYFRVFGQSFVAGIAILIGLVLLVIPGLWLMTIWFVAAPVLVVENEAIIESLGRSKALVQPRFWSIAAIVLIMMIAYAGTTVLQLMLIPFPSVETLPLSFPLNVLIQAAQSLGWVVSLAAYIKLSGEELHEPMENIFA